MVIFNDSLYTDIDSDGKCRLTCNIEIINGHVCKYACNPDRKRLCRLFLYSGELERTFECLRPIAVFTFYLFRKKDIRMNTHLGLGQSGDIMLMLAV